MSKLPIKLAKEPIIDAVFELRMQSVFPLSNILTGILFSKLDGEKVIENLAITNLPKQLRDADPNLRFAPLIKIHWDGFMLLVGDQSVAVACKLPYPRWVNLKKAIQTVINIILGANIVTVIERYSMKYVNIIDSSSVINKANLVNLNIMLGEHTVSDKNFQLRVEIPNNNFISAIQIVSDASVILP
ncbi:MAG: TIGR04255 family protein, partial [Agitococcus sp.]|nr:TIGR04255 family protein [Agitococcus sp.]